MSNLNWIQWAVAGYFNLLMKSCPSSSMLLPRHNIKCMTHTDFLLLTIALAECLQVTELYDCLQPVFFDLKLTENPLPIYIHFG